VFEADRFINIIIVELAEEGGPQLLLQADNDPLRLAEENVRLRLQLESALANERAALARYHRSLSFVPFIFYQNGSFKLQK